MCFCGCVVDFFKFSSLFMLNSYFSPSSLSLSIELSYCCFFIFYFFYFLFLVFSSSSSSLYLNLKRRNFIRLSPCGCVMIDVPRLFRVSIVHQVYCRHIQLTMFAINVYSTMFVFAGLRPMLYCCVHRNVHLNPGEMHLQPESILNLTIKARCICNL